MSIIAPSGHKLGGRFVVEHEVGRGGVGIVYRAYDLLTLQTVALKVINAEAGVAPEEEANLMREGELLASLDHPGIVKTVAFGVLEDTGLPFVAMEWLDGEDSGGATKARPAQHSGSARARAARRRSARRRARGRRHPPRHQAGQHLSVSPSQAPRG
ncbi:MAG: hypothetical protein QM756_16215 [Polyangiaceae bacterium]